MQNIFLSSVAGTIVGATVGSVIGVAAIAVRSKLQFNNSDNLLGWSYTLPEKAKGKAPLLAKYGITTLKNEINIV